MQEVLEETLVTEPPTTPSSKEEPQQSGSSRERRKSKKPKAQQSKDEICCTITTVPSLPTVNNGVRQHQQAIEEDKESRKLSIATNDASSRKSSMVTDKTGDNSTTAKSLNLLIPTKPPSLSDPRTKVTGGDKPVATVKKNIPFVPMVDRKRVRDFLRRNKYKRPIALSQQEDAELLLTPEIERVLNMNRNGLGGNQEAIDEMNKQYQILKDQVTQLKAETRTELRRAYQDEFTLNKDIQMNEWMKYYMPQFELQSNKYLKGTTNGHYEIADTIEADKTLQRVCRVNRAMLVKMVQKQTQKDRCCDAYANLLSVLRKQESIVDCHVNSTCATHAGKHVLKNQIKILNCVHHYLLTKGLWVFTKRESTTLKTWRQTIQSYEVKQQHLTETIQQISATIQKQQQNTKRDLDLLKSAAIEHQHLMGKLSDSLAEYESRVLASKELMLLKEKQIDTRKSIAQQNGEVCDLKQLLDALCSQLEEERNKPKTYEPLFTEWNQIRADLESQSAQLKEEQEVKEEFKAKILENKGKIHRLQLCEQDLKAELQRVDEKKKALDESYAEMMCHRKKLQMKTRQYKYSSFSQQ